MLLPNDPKQLFKGSWFRRVNENLNSQDYGRSAHNIQIALTLCCMAKAYACKQCLLLVFYYCAFRKSSEKNLVEVKPLVLWFIRYRMSTTVDNMNTSFNWWKWRVFSIVEISCPNKFMHEHQTLDAVPRESPEMYTWQIEKICERFEPHS